MAETPDRWHTRLRKTARSHGRIAVVSSCATAGVILALGTTLLAQNISSRSSDPTAQSAVSSTLESNGLGGEIGGLPESTVTTVIGGPPTSSFSDNAPQGSVTTNTSSSGTPGASPPETVVTTPNPAPNATSPPSTVISDVTTTTSPRRSANGPLLPTITTDVTASTDDPMLKLKLTAGDKDGYVSRVVIDWGDQSVSTVIDYPLSSCVEPLGSSETPTANHKYTTANSYTVTVTVTSVNCVGDGAQQTITTKPVSVGGSEPTTTTSSPPPAG